MKESKFDYLLQKLIPERQIIHHIYFFLRKRPNYRNALKQYQITFLSFFAQTGGIIHYFDICNNNNIKTNHKNKI